MCTELVMASGVWGFGCDCVAGGCVKRPLCIAGMTEKELTIFISESMFTGFEYIILISKGIPTQLWLPKITTCIVSRKL